MTTLNQPINIGDFILVHSPNKAYMLIVMGTPSPSTIPEDHKVILNEINWHIPFKQGYWMPSGPKIEYDYEPDEPPHRVPESTCLCNEHLDVGSTATVDLAGFFKNAGIDAQAHGLTLIVNPHGRDVFKHYFNDRCPVCDSEHMIDPGSVPGNLMETGTNEDPKVRQPCPVCMGEELAVDDGTRLGIIRDLIPELWREGSYMSHEQRGQLRMEIAQSIRERYEFICHRLLEMGFLYPDTA
ncbi:uncharacterized protein BO97DRAFT_411200 [Aspergillus homomorphus CBS 101889]|uniref:Uncharacterized protein n=1 Tax=Aspergillus homomorphus (strain CBS 101889) TaxID=1450537 RepID=A0A395ICL5_ASPHC|nr:hypothetical protein BO97DRAFT_411200 [Aspergillus homomorphus CBS 101889]RAL15914.1 hypothetical protein BO97DRAFT_411200 [Aspergillus homomorphus CBS 101889]